MAEAKPGTRQRSRGAGTRERIVDAAARLFYRHGIGSVSVDAVAEAAGVTKRTLYNHFRSKDDLVAAYLEARDQPNLALFQAWFDAADDDLADRLRALFRKLAENAGGRSWKGCGYLRTAAELVATPGHPAVQAARRHKRNVEAWLSSVIAAERPKAEAERLARQLQLLMDGAFAAGLLHRDPDYMQAAGEAADALLRRSEGR
ncbi:TetR/AcrR family transcriptional regulator [Mesorhizobium marinum]|uniref:TetR/AcrR family transcriptional regulator n=1 Tax=Mesorhizobium marinum TaxID=3228790 RepID=UPI0034672064